MATTCRGVGGIGCVGRGVDQEVGGAPVLKIETAGTFADKHIRFFVYCVLPDLTYINCHQKI